MPLVSMIMVSTMSQTTERFKLCSANDFLAQTSWLSSPDVDSFRLIGLVSMHLIMLVRLEPREVPVPAWGFSIKNPTIESEVSWSSLLSFLL